jgi:hypothetical protein
MALDMDHLKLAIEVFRESPADKQDGYLASAHSCLDALNFNLPALSEVDRAAVAFFIAGIFTAIREVKVQELSAIMLDSGVGYTLATALLLDVMGDVNDPRGA